MKRIELETDVSPAIGPAGPLTTAALACLPDELPERPVVAFCWPGGGYSREYFDIHVAGFDGYSQAEHHTARGIVVVACDHLGTGASSETDRSQLSHENVAAANRATVDGVLGELDLRDPVLVGVGHSFGGELLIVQQGRQRTFAGIAILGYSAIEVRSPRPPADGVSAAGGRVPPPDEMTAQDLRTYAFHWEDVPEEIVREDMKGEHPAREQPLPMWASDRRPGGRHWTHRGAPVAHWANVIECPVFVGFGERDAVADPHLEPTAYRRSRDVTLFVGPRMAHVHNFAGTRHLLWDRLATWMQGLRDQTFG